MKATVILLSLVLTLGITCVEARNFQDNFNRPDSTTVGNGWSDTAGNTGGNLAIKNNELTCPSAGRAGIFRHFLLTASTTVTARVKEQNGFGTLLRRYMTRFAVRSDGVLRSGYGVRIARSDELSNNSQVILIENDTSLASIPSTFQYGPELDVSVTFNLDGSIIGTVSEPAPSTNTFDFSFGPLAIQSTGNNFSIDVACDDGPVDPRIDDVVITQASPRLDLFLTGCTDCDVGDTFSVTARVQNPTIMPIPVEVKAGVELPDGSEFTAWIVPDLHFEVTLPAGLDTRVLLFRVTIPPGLPPGVWGYEGALLTPVLGRTLARDTKSFMIR